MYDYELVVRMNRKSHFRVPGYQQAICGTDVWQYQPRLRLMDPMSYTSGNLCRSCASEARFCLVDPGHVSRARQQMRLAWAEVTA